MANENRSIFTQHSRRWQDNTYVYPVISRRSRGLSIGVNLNPDKSCNFDCVYCCVDRTTSPAVRHVDLSVVQRELEPMIQLAVSGELFEQSPLNTAPPEYRRLNDIAFSGDGEPTACKLFPDACRLVAELLQRFRLPDVKIIPITNATLLDRPAVAAALEFLDRHNGELWAKLDAGTEAYFRQVERTRVPLQRVLDNLAEAGRKRPIVIQSLFMRLHGQAPPPEEIAAYAARLGELAARGGQIKLVQIYTVARATAESFVSPLEVEALDAIAGRVRELGLKVETYA